MVEKILTGFFLLVSVVYLLTSRGMAFGSMNSPKSGFLPAVVGVAATILALILFISVMVKGKKLEKIEINWEKLVMFLGGILAYIIFLNIIGYRMATFIVMFILLKVTKTKGWIIPLLVSAGVSFGFYYLFQVLLGVRLP